VKRPAWVWSWRIALLLAVLAILLCTLFPYTFVVPQRAAHRVRDLVEIGTERGPDVLLNVLLFVPLGIALGGELGRQRVSTRMVLPMVLLGSGTFSYVLEAAQRALPARFGSLGDVLSNMAGAAAGVLLHNEWRRGPARLTMWAYVTAVVLASVPLQWNTTLRTWNPSFPLVIGAGAPGGPPWLGSIHSVAVLDRAITAHEARGFYDGTRSVEGSPSLVVSYQFPESARTLTSVGPAMDPSRAGVTWLRTSGPAADLTRRLRSTSRFTLVVTAGTHQTFQDGVYGIVALSHDANHRNFTLAQQKSDLVFRLRNLVTGDAASGPQLVVPNVFSTTAVHHLVITYDGLELKSFVDGVQRSAVLFGLGTAAFAPVFGGTVHMFPMYSGLYYFCVFAPLGWLVSKAAARTGGRSRRAQVIAMELVLSALSLETILVAAGSRVVSISNVLWSVMAGAAGALFCQLRHPALQPRHVAGPRPSL
jgi:VanZ family protein